MNQNQAAKNAIVNSPLLMGQTRQDADLIVDILVRKGLLAADEIPRHQQYAQAARDWLYSINSQTARAKDIWYYASGWDTAGWEHVLKCQGFEFSELQSKPERIKDVTKAILILAQDAGITVLADDE